MESVLGPQVVQAVVSGVIGGIAAGAAAFGAIKTHIWYMRRDIDHAHRRLDKLEQAK